MPGRSEITPVARHYADTSTRITAPIRLAEQRIPIVFPSNLYNSQLICCVTASHGHTARNKLAPPNPPRPIASRSITEQPNSERSPRQPCNSQQSRCVTASHREQIAAQTGKDVAHERDVVLLGHVVLAMNLGIACEWQPRGGTHPNAPKQIHPIALRGHEYFEPRMKHRLNTDGKRREMNRGDERARYF